MLKMIELMVLLRASHESLLLSARVTHCVIVDSDYIDQGHSCLYCELQFLSTVK